MRHHDELQPPVEKSCEILLAVEPFIHEEYGIREPKIRKMGEFVHQGTHIGDVSWEHPHCHRKHFVALKVQGY